MKRFIWLVTGIFLFSVEAFSQPSLGNYSQRGVASQEMKTSGFFAAHPSLPLNSKVKVTNPKNNKEIEVTVIDRISPSSDRIIDLSFAAMEVLELKDGGTVIIRTGTSAPAARFTGYEDTIVDLGDPYAPPRFEKPDTESKTEESAAKDNASVVTAPGAAADTPLEKKSDNQGNNHTPSIIVNTYVNSADEHSSAKEKVSSRTDTEFLAWLLTSAYEARQARESRESSEIREAREVREYREAREAKEAEKRAMKPASYEEKREKPAVKDEGNSPDSGKDAQTHEIKHVSPGASFTEGALDIIPGLPDRNSGKIYRLQIGAYSAYEAAVKAAEHVKSAGFNVESEYTGSVYRVLACGIASSDVYSASVKLCSMGFFQIWVRE